jgi:putative lipoprotein
VKEGRPSAALFFSCRGEDGLRRFLLLAGATLAIAGCSLWRGAPPPAGMPTQVTGTVRYPEKVTLLPDTQLRVTLSETSRADAPAQFIAETTIPNVARVPTPFQVKFDPRAIDPKLTYTLRARVERADQLLFINDAAVRVLTHGAPAHVDISVVPVSTRP